MEDLSKAMKSLPIVKIGNKNTVKENQFGLRQDMEFQALKETWRSPGGAVSFYRCGSEGPKRWSDTFEITIQIRSRT